jgi:WD40 repeat protein
MQKMCPGLPGLNSPRIALFSLLVISRGSIHIWDLRTRMRQAVLKGHRKLTIRIIHFSQDSLTLASVADGYQVALWCTKMGRSRSNFPHESSVEELLFIGNDQLVPSGGNTIYVLDAKNCKLQHKIEDAASKSLQASANGQLLFSFSNTKKIQI